MEQTDPPEAKVRRRWWAYRSKVEHLEDNESIEYGVPFVRVQSQPEPREYSFSHRKRRPVLGNVAEIQKFSYVTPRSIYGETSNE